MDIMKFQDIVWDYYNQSGRNNLLWRRDLNPYKIVVSEIMLQQTQVNRVSQKFPEFIIQFPDFLTLSRSTLTEVLTQWQGLGYNRRGKYLLQIAQKIVDEFGGEVPRDISALKSLPGIGENTAGAILAYSFNIPTIFIETNIRRIFIHHFFENQTEIHDKEIIPLVASSIELNKYKTRDWYWALMDYGTYLAQTLPNPNHRSVHYSKQPQFEGSNRQIRSTILKYLLINPLSLNEIKKLFKNEENRIEVNLEALIKENFIQHQNNTYNIKSI